MSLNLAPEARSPSGHPMREVSMQLRATHGRRRVLCALAILSFSVAPLSTRAATRCEDGLPLRLHVYDVGNASAALVQLPDGRLVMVDAGADRRALAALVRSDLRGRDLSMMWITHPHDDHLNQVKGILRHSRIGVYVDDGFDGGSRSRSRPGGLGVRMRAAAAAAGARTVSVTPEQRTVPLERDGDAVSFTAVLPARWPATCLRGNLNDCSIGLRIDYCGSSMLFPGDAEADEEGLMTPLEPVTLLVVGHHGSSTSSTPLFLSRTRPRYAVVSAGRARRYCHPSLQTIRRLNVVLGGEVLGDLASGLKLGRECTWEATGRSGRLWSTATDGTIDLVTCGDGSFQREERGVGLIPPAPAPASP